MDGDGFIGTSDIEHALKLLTQNELNMEEIQSVWEKVNNVNILQIIELFITFFVLFNYNYNLKQFQVLVEGDIDDDHRLSKNEFQNVITKSPEFMTTFHFSI